MAIGEKPYGIAMHRPEAAQQIPRDIGQRHKTVFITFGRADMDALALCVKIAHFQS